MSLFYLALWYINSSISITKRIKIILKDILSPSHDWKAAFFLPISHGHQADLQSETVRHRLSALAAAGVTDDMAICLSLVKNT